MAALLWHVGLCTQSHMIYLLFTRWHSSSSYELWPEIRRA